MYYHLVPIILIQLFIDAAESKDADCAMSSKDTVDSFDVRFYICSNEVSDCGEVSVNSLTAEILEDHGFDPSEETFILTHGFYRDHNEDWVQKMYRLLLKRGNPNVILVNWSAATLHSIFSDWKSMFRLMDYKSGVLSTEHAASETSSFLRNISNAWGTPLNEWRKLHFIGHSLGAHVSGQAARNLKHDVKVHRVTGLDPAGPCFEGQDSKLKLNRMDAKFVDVIHTNSDPGENLNFGIHEPVGTIDIYPNGGNYHPDCRPMAGFPNPLSFAYKVSRAMMGMVARISMAIERLLFDPNVDMNDLATAVLTRRMELICEHYMAPEFFSRTLEDDAEQFLAVPMEEGEPYDENEVRCQILDCDSNNCIEMGINAENYEEATGSYWTVTSEGDPQCW